ncbi:N-acetylmuramoyl-L-alanine amidase [Halocynthiibacter sp. C4]|uniref:N-acetylmuramoyl-L-alanine amidase n=2 Tax=Halocynthiibacter sp. C4 TaxID=2992758 RepID=UPI00237B7A4B|nr:N-acetylmuramoyl-L-alanine amidase [Halocynthiibacter sp. C4]MDE0590237.1 N-acetylmuramoyl-L-alanine amidase [Halocynthiibacter sp. C4]
MASDPLRIIQRPSPNFGPRRGDAVPDMIVLHYTAMDTCEAAAERLCSPEFEVSAHYLISEKGDIFQLVDEDARAWHAGAGAWGGVNDINSRSIGIELANTGKTPFSALQMNALERLMRDIMERRCIPKERVIGHSDMAPARKGDPGARFDWRRLAFAGLSIWLEAGEARDAAPKPDDFQSAARTFGYPADAPFDALLSAFRQRFRPHYDGALDQTDMAQIQALARQYPALTS